MAFRYRAVDILELDGERLLASERQAALSQLLILAGLRRMGEVVEQEARKMPILNDILDHEVLGREFKKGLAEGVQQGVRQGMQQGELKVLRRLIEKRFGAMPHRRRCLRRRSV